MREYISLAAGLISVVGYVPYVRDIVAGTTKPDRAAWWIWAAQYGLLFATQLSTQNRAALWLPGLQLAGILLVAGLAVRYGEGRFGAGKQAMLAAVILALGLWRVVHSPLVVLLLSLGVEACGIALTVYKAYRNPASETLTMWTLVCAGGTLDALALGPHVSFVAWCYPVALTLLNGSVVLAVLAGRYRRSPHTARQALLNLSLQARGDWLQP